MEKETDFEQKLTCSGSELGNVKNHAEWVATLVSWEG